MICDVFLDELFLGFVFFGMDVVGIYIFFDFFLWLMIL